MTPVRMRVAFVLVSLFAVAAVAAPFEPLFVIRRTVGRCEVRTPGSQEFAEAAAGRAYLYGSTVRTGQDGLLVVEFSAGGNECTVGPDSLVTVAENKSSKNEKVLVVDSGKISVSLEENYDRANTISIETPCANAKANGRKFTVSVRQQEDLLAASFMPDKGTLTVSGPQFDIPELDEDDVLGVSSGLNGMFTRVVCDHGEFALNVADSQGAPQTVAMRKDQMVKIWRKSAATGETLVSILVATPDGVLTQQISRVEAPAGISTAMLPVDTDHALDFGEDPESVEDPPSTNGSAGTNESGTVTGGAPDAEPDFGGGTYGASDTPFTTVPPSDAIRDEEPTPTEVGKR